ncbi:hypothetical protein BRADI_1g01645v3 [Brachypodium distachyon]|uniref:Uncharacterized protein n=1 Tax=Brachypodium distachyon TaxID=15368 RepID=A0A0Q3GLZ9_BRADI|nr:hypothetical protein BRADI_1g01645v3 [Brachypodium distachyon]
MMQRMARMSRSSTNWTSSGGRGAGSWSDATSSAASTVAASVQQPWRARAEAGAGSASSVPPSLAQLCCSPPLFSSPR